MATQAIPPHPSGDCWSRACEFSGNLDGFKTSRRVLVTKSEGGSFGMVTVPLTFSFAQLAKGKSLGRSKPAT